MSARRYLKNAILLCGESDGTVFKRAFVIVKKLSEGGSTVCYEAYHGNSGRGVLKEFYPRGDYALKRTKSGQLVHSPKQKEAHERFLQAEKDYTASYELLLQVKQIGENQDLAASIPTFEIYHGCDESGNVIGTTYIWMPEPKLETFDKVCSEIHKHPKQNPEHKLVTVLLAIESLTKCIGALHDAKMLHRDIKPSNFGFMKRGNDTLTQALSMFDIDSVCTIPANADGRVGTDGYREQESEQEAATVQTDIYAIGATLFHAVIVSEEAKEGKYLYRDSYYDRLREMVDGSKLIRASEINSHPRLRNLLTGILKKCLCERANRYADCKELLSDLEKALYYALPSELARRNRPDERWVLADVENALDANNSKEKNSFLAIQYHLYEHPLYQCSADGEDTINVLVIGFGNYGQKFLDACLQTGQMRNKKLRVTVLSDNETDKEIYLSGRPQLAEFFDIDGSLAGRADAYGTVVFATKRLERGDQSANAAILKDVMCEYEGDDRLHYVFVALGEDALNLTAANACREALEIFEMDCVVGYVCENEQASDGQTSILCPIYVNADVKRSALHEEIERMAFNTHLVWEKDLNIDYASVKANYRKKYNHDSSVSGVLSLKYKLHSIGIDPDVIGFDEAARRYRELFADGKRLGLKNELIWIEHRRWVTEKLCLGWRRIDNLKDCAGGVTKDERGKRHVCLVRSRPDRKLAEEYGKDGKYDKWDKAANAELDRLDELDRMSVELHRMFTKNEKDARKEILLTESSMTGVRELIKDDKKAVVAFREWTACLKDIWNREIGKVRLYKGLKAAFLKAADALPREKSRAVQEHVKAFEAMFYPILASLEYRDWKQDDVALIEKIPFILTYTERAYLVIPFATGNNSDVFENVAAAAVAAPERILYLYLVERKQDLTDLQESIPYVVEYMRKKRFKAAVEFILVYYDTMAPFVTEEVEKELAELGGGRIRQVKRLRVNGFDTVSTELEAYLKRREVGKRFFAVEKNSAKLSYLLQGSGFYRAFANYRFDSIGMEFCDMSGCDMLGDIGKKPFITVTDMAAFRLSDGDGSNQPEFFEDYQELWGEYSKNSECWKMLCDILKDYAKKNDVLTTLKKMNSGDKAANADVYNYIIPLACSKSAMKIIQFLKEKEVLESGSSVIGYTTDSCKVTIVDRCNYREIYDKLFAKVYALMMPDAITCYLNTKNHEIVVRFDDLVVTGVSVAGNKSAKLIALMEYFKEKKYVINLTNGPNDKLSFTYATGRIKELLTTAGKILEVYTYHKAKALGTFDDVVSGFEIDWEGTGVTSEFDCILTKGFQALFVECKARPDIDQDYYFKLSQLAEQFGINATAVLIADTQEQSHYDNAPVNAMQRKRGKMMDVVTIWKHNEINEIDKTLLKILEGTYVSTEEPAPAATGN